MPKRNHLGAERVVRPTLPRAHATMNAAPFSSVLMAMIALLIMAMAQFEQVGLDAFLPLVAPASLDDYMMQVVVEITADRVITLNSATVTLSELEGRLRPVLAARRAKTVFVIGAGSLRYGDVVPLIDAACGAGAQRVGIVTERMLKPRF
jgi:biopolymer transport protein TolR